MITYTRTNGKMPNCGRCKTPMKYWDLRNDESTYRCDKCESVEISEYWARTIRKVFQDAKEKINQNEK